MTAIPAPARPRGWFSLGLAILLLAAGIAAVGALRGPLPAAEAVAALAVAVVLVRSFELSILLMTAAFAFGELAAGVGGPGAVKVLGAATVVAWGWRWASGATRAVLVPQFWFLAGLALWLVPSTLMAQDRQAALSTSARYAMFVALFFLVVQYTVERGRLERFVDVVVVAATLSALLGLADFLSGRTPGAASGPLQHNDFAYVLGTALPFAVWRARTHPDRRARIALVVASLVLAVAIAGTLSRGAYVAVGVALLWLVVRRGRRRVSVPPRLVLAAAAAVAIALAAGLATGALDRALTQKSNVAAKNADSRVYYWRIAGREFASSPLFGVGPGNYETRFTDFGQVYDFEKGVQTTHNTYLNVLAELGLGGLLFLGGYLVSAWMLVRVRLPDRVEDELQAALGCALIIAVVGSAFLTEQFQAPLWTVPALAAAAAPRRRPTV